MGRTTVGNLSVILTTRTAKFMRGLKGATRSVKRTAAAMVAAGATAVTFGAALATAGVGILGVFVKKQFSAIDATTKLSDQLGIATENLVGYHHAAAITGAKQETVNKGFQRMVRTIGDANAELPTGIRALEMVGLELKDIKGQSSEKVFGKIADNIAGMSSTADQAAASYAVFGRSGMDLLNMLRLGSAGMAEMQQEAENLGLTFDRSGGAKIEMANDALQRLGSLFTGLIRQISVQLAPWVETLAKRLVKTGTEGEGMGGKVTEGFKSFTLAMAKTLDFLDFFKGSWHGLIQVIKAGKLAFISAATAIVLQMEKLMAALGEPSDTLKDMRKALMAVGKATEKEMNDAAAAADAAFEGFQTGRRSKDAEKFFKDLAANAKAAADEIAKNAKERGATGLLDPDGGGGTPGKPAQFRQIVRERFAFGSRGSNTQTVQDPQLKTVIEVLRDIYAKPAGMG